MGREQSKAKKKSAGFSRGESFSFVDLVADKFLNIKQKMEKGVRGKTVLYIDEESGVEYPGGRAIRIDLKAEQTIKKQGIGCSMYKSKTDTNQSSSSQSGGDPEVNHSKSTHEVDGDKKNTTTTTTSTHACVNLAEGDNHSQAFLGLVRRLVLTSTKKSEDSQRHNIFQTRCKINQNVFNVIIDGGSSKNIISRDIVTHLKLTPKKHPKPYKIGWIKVVGEVRVTEQCEVLFAMGKYKDTVLFDIVDMDTCHVLLGRPWPSDLNVLHRVKENTYTFSKDGHKFTLCPYSDEVQATTAKVLNPIKNSWSSSIQEGENDGGPTPKKGVKDNSNIIK
uniref:Uncharacterized protein n=1 Tax=Tanacetum cinerariifolium TaxID=118510 RepID=A0A6L2JDZ5_TANCI|nr:hypothetical protein [Tanacetum cinerariifolium]